MKARRPACYFLKTRCVQKNRRFLRMPLAEGTLLPYHSQTAVRSLIGVYFLCGFWLNVHVLYLSTRPVFQIKSVKLSNQPEVLQIPGTYVERTLWLTFPSALLCSSKPLFGTTSNPAFSTSSAPWALLSGSSCEMTRRDRCGTSLTCLQPNFRVI